MATERSICLSIYPSIIQSINRSIPGLDCCRPGDSGEIEFLSDRSHPSILVSFHDPAIGGCPVVVPEQVKDTVDEVSNDLVGPVGAMDRRLRNGFVDADEQFAVDCRGIGRIGIAVIESDHIGGSGVSKELVIDSRHLAGADEVDAEAAGQIADASIEEPGRDALEHLSGDRPFSLATDDLEFTDHSFRTRWVS